MNLKILPIIALVSCLFLSTADADSSTASPLPGPLAYKPLPTGAATPKGWLLEQLKLQADGLSGHLSQFWPDIMSSIWMGGKADGGLHERVPYWLNGVVPLAFLLKNAGAEVRPGATGIYHDKTGAVSPVNITEQAERYVEHIAGYQVPAPQDCKPDLLLLYIQPQPRVFCF